MLLLNQPKAHIRHLCTTSMLSFQKLMEGTGEKLAKDGEEFENGRGVVQNDYCKHTWLIRNKEKRIWYDWLTSFAYCHGTVCWKKFVQIWLSNDICDRNGLYPVSWSWLTFSGMFVGLGRPIVERWPTILRVEGLFVGTDDDKLRWRKDFVEGVCWAELPSIVVVISDIRSRFHQKSLLKRVIHALSSRNKYRSMGLKKRAYVGLFFGLRK